MIVTEKVMKRFFKILIAGIFCLVLLFIVLYITGPKDVNRGFRYHVNNLLGVRCIDYKQLSYSKKLTDKIPDYIGKSSQSGIVKCKNEKEIIERADQGKLFEVKNGSGFIIGELSHSYPYLTKDGKELLTEIGRRFKEKISGTRLKGSRFKITSVTRTTENIQRLRKINSNASASSPHLYGNTFDISYIRFTSRKWFLTNCDKKFLKEALAEVIWKLREEKKCWATYEVRQSCFHVVSR
jgi:hypothetical protein